MSLKASKPDLIESLRKLHGLPPYDKGLNPCLHDAYMAMAIRRDHSEADIKAAEKELGLA